MVNKKSGVVMLLIVYFVLVVFDILLNLMAGLVPAFGAVAETATELVIELTSAIIVLILTFKKRG